MNEEKLKQFGAYIKTLREASGMSQEELDRMIELGRQAKTLEGPKEQEPEVIDVTPIDSTGKAMMKEAEEDE